MKGDTCYCAILDIFFLIEREYCFEQGLCGFRYLLLYLLGCLVTTSPDSVLTGDLISLSHSGNIEVVNVYSVS